jgi:ribosomal protein S18 acetylase RimI-like enzyme
MSESVFEKFKSISQSEYAKSYSAVESLKFEDALKNASEQFDRLVSKGLETPGQLFYEAIEEKSDVPVGYLWLGIQERSGRKVASVNDIIIISEHRGHGFGKALMNCVEKEAKRAGSKRIRLHVFYKNEVARNLYASMGFQPTSIDMVKLI